MDDSTLHAWKEFMAGPGGKDLLGRFIANEMGYLAEGAKAQTIDEKGIAMAHYEAIYRLRSGVQDIVAPKSKPASSQAGRTGSK